MKSIYIPISQNNLNFIEKYHPKKIRLSIKSDMGLQFLGILKLYSLNYEQRNEKFIKDHYPVYLEILVNEMVYPVVKNISMRGVHALNVKIDLMMKNEAYRFVKEELRESKDENKDKKVKIADAMNKFFDFYGLMLNPKELSTLERFERRLREKNGELLYKQNRVKLCQLQNAVSIATI